MMAVRMSNSVNSSLPQYLLSNPRLGQRVCFNNDGTVTIRPGKVEIGQGILSAIAQMAAEELDISYSRIQVSPVDTTISPNEASTSGSRSIQEGGESMRYACAEIRHLFLEAGSVRLNIPITSLKVSDGLICGDNSKQTISYWDLLADVDLDVDAIGRARPKNSSDYQLVGSPLPRKDILKKITGAAFLHDMTLPGMLHGRIARPPSFGAKLISFDDQSILIMPGVKKVIKDGGFIGVVAEREEQAIKAMLAIKAHCKWRESAELPDVNELEQFLYDQNSEDEILKAVSSVSHDVGIKISSTYTRPYLAHASIGPSCALAWWHDNNLEIWSHSQSIYALRDEIAKILKLDVAQVIVRHAEGAGCYGHNGADDVALDAALLALESDGLPVRVQWMREDEFAWEPFGPAMAVKLNGSVNSSGQITAWHEEIWGNRHIGRAGRQPKPGLLAAWHIDEDMEVPLPVDMPIAMGGGSQRNAVPYYDLPNCNVVNHVIQAMPIRVSALRALGAYINVFAIESFMDELAAVVKMDPIEFRLRHLKDERAIAVLKAVSSRANWQPDFKSDGAHGYGVAFARYKNVGNYAAVIAEVSIEENIRVKNVFAAIDCGLVINPDGVLNQIEGGIVQATSWTLKEQLQFDRTRITSLNWEEYPILTFSEVPRVEIELINRPDEPALGVGEGVTGPVAAAIANAVSNAMGVRVRRLPMTQANIISAMDDMQT
jgi:CO/xanthine dehydrogenase Mo-binding subunit